MIDVIQSKNEYALQSSVSQLSGSMSRKVRELREKLIYEIAFIESALDDPGAYFPGRIPGAPSGDAAAD